MDIRIWYRHMLRHEAGEDTFIPDEENEMTNEIKRIHKPTPIGDSHQRIYHWFGEEFRKQQPVVMTAELKAAIKDCLN